ncbi:uncharacterized protein LOC117233707 [Bombus vosnesenskii]|uniref:Uncharacterized protein LOC117233707 n=2 Tax=Pyrobombus TaxID=144703 RepID=A0A6J3KBL8_9HYME|nr:uncharacterized protein LOC117155917 [Bombus vancouverensis nearcticus]XP_033297428.1 uncharacterized protein LOC117204279 [Bombus bifarius]XP_033350150.1 uncharacterized protein LOC117233707 [Bombus vosnesenskii]XP_050478262.1 uncharacterized protein LOC126867615 isoform X1 [Bombus huntii]XP_050478263.1 uncharacterized protein LOC126867615 isoform X1 [Bombus huntii]
MYMYTYIFMKIMMSPNNEKHDLHLMKYVNKSTELKIIRGTLNTKTNKLRLKKEILKERYKDLDNINCKVWVTEDEFCNEIWNFSLRHNFNSIFNQNSHITKVDELHKCKYNTVIGENLNKVDMCNKVLKLKNEIDITNKEIILIRNKNTETDLKYCESTLDDLKSFSEEILQLIRLIITSGKNVYNTMINRKLSTSMMEEFTSARKLFQKSNFCGSALTENIVSPSKIIEESKECHNIKHNVKFGRFIMKTRSLISLKYEKKM